MKRSMGLARLACVTQSYLKEALIGMGLYDETGAPVLGHSGVLPPGVAEQGELSERLAGLELCDEVLVKEAYHARVHDEHVDHVAVLVDFHAALQYDEELQAHVALGYGSLPSCRLCPPA